MFKSLLQKRILGVNISDSNIEIVELGEKRGKIVLEAFARTQLDTGIIEKGVIKKADILETKLSKVLKQGSPKSFSTKKAILSINESLIYTIPLQLPAKSSEEEIEKQIQANIQNMVPVNFSQLHTFYQPLAGNKQQHLLFLGVEKKGLQELTSIAESAGLEVQGYDAESASAARATLKRIPPSKGVMFLDIGSQKATISIYDKQGLSVSTTLPIAGWAFTKTIALTLKAPVEKAEQIKTTQGLSGSNDETDAIQKPLRELIQKIVKEINEASQYYTQLTGNDVGNLYLYGGSAQMPGLVDFLAEQLPKINVTFSKPWIVTKDIKWITALFYIEPIGLALKGIGYGDDIGIKRFFPMQKTKKTKFSKYFTLFEKVEKEKTTTPKGSEERTDEVNAQFQKSKKIPKAKAFNKDYKKTELTPPENMVLLFQKIKIRKVYAIILLIILYSFAIGAVPLQYFIFTRYYGKNSQTPRGHIAIETQLDINLEEDSENEVSYRLIEQTPNISFHFTATGVTEGGDQNQVSGEVTITNETSSGYNLVPTTRLETEDGILFRLDEQTEVPAESTVTAHITADQEGTEYNITKDTQLTFPGLTEDLKSSIYAVANADLTIGSAVYVTKDDLENAEKELEDRTNQIEVDDLEWDVETDEIVMSQFLSVNVTSIELNAKEGDYLESFEGVATINISVLVFKEEELFSYALDRMSTHLEEYEKLENYKITGVEVFLDDYDDEEGIVKLILETNASLINS